MDVCCVVTISGICMLIGYQVYYFRIAGVFDAVVLVATLAHTAFYILEASSAGTSSSSLHTVRTFRLLRIIRLLQTFPALAMLVKGMFSTFIAILDVMILLTALCYAGALLCCEILGSSEHGRNLFESLFQGFLTHIQLVLIEAWPDIATQMMLNSYFWGVYVVTFLLVSNFAILNVVTGVICERVLLLAANKPPDTLEEAEFKRTGLRDRISQLYRDIVGKAPDISQEELLDLLQSSQAMAILKAMKVALPQKIEDLSNIMNRDQVRSISISELQDGLMRLRGSSYDRLSLESHCSVHKTFWLCHGALAKASAAQKATMREARQAFARHITETLQLPTAQLLLTHIDAEDVTGGTADLVAIRMAIVELQNALLNLQTQCSLLAQHSPELGVNPSVSTQTQEGVAGQAESPKDPNNEMPGNCRPSSKMPPPLPSLPRPISLPLPPAPGKGAGVSSSFTAAPKKVLL